MDKVIADKWIAELRSGKHKQGKGRLVNSDGEKCCLGVLAIDVCGLPEVQAKDTGYLNKLPGFKNPLKTKNGQYLRGGSNLADLNDLDGKTFAEIADVVERNYENL